MRQVKYTERRERPEGCRAALVLALTAMLLLAAPAATARAGACDVRRHAAAGGERTPGRRAALVVGDSTILLAVPLLGRHGLEADARGCRQFAEGVRSLAARRRAGALPHLVVLALGTNGPVTRRDVERALRVVSPGRVLALVTPTNSPRTQAVMRAAARAHPDRVLLMDWHRHSAGRRVFAGDGIHVTSAGAAVYARFLARRAAPVIRPPARSLVLPAVTTTGKDCGAHRRFGRRLAVRVLRGRDRITCARARSIAGRPPLQGIPGWRWADWTPLPGAWVDVYRRADGRVLVATAPAPHARPVRPRTSALRRAGTEPRAGENPGSPVRADIAPGRLGWLRLLLTAPTGSAVLVQELVPSRPPVDVARLLAGPGVTGRARLAPWRCDRRARAFAVTVTLPDGTVHPQSLSASTPSCAGRVALRVRSPRYAGRPLRVVVRDRWGTGDLALRLCVSHGGARPACRSAELAPGRPLRALSVPVRGSGPLRVQALGPPGVRATRTVLPTARPGGPRLLVTGDSMIQLVDAALAARLRSRSVLVRVRSDARISTGLTKPFLLNWLQHAAVMASAVRPDVTVVFLGANDGYGIGGVSCCTPRWSRRYAVRAAEVMRAYARRGAGRVYWILLPAPRKPGFREVFAGVNRGLRLAAARVPGVRLVDPASVITPGGRFRRTVRRDGRIVVVRQEDGIHLTTAGAGIVADLVLAAIRADGAL